MTVAPTLFPPSSLSGAERLVESAPVRFTLAMQLFDRNKLDYCYRLGDHMADVLPGEITVLLEKLRDGDREAESTLLSLVYRELRRIASRRLRRERADHTLQTTALVNEAYVRLFRKSEIDWHSRTHFYAIAARTMRRVLVDYARAQGAAKRGGGPMALPFDVGLTVSAERCGQITELDDALKLLSEQEERVGKVIELRFFAGLSFEEVAEALGISVRTAKRDWEFGRAWLRSELESQA